MLWRGEASVFGSTSSLAVTEKKLMIGRMEGVVIIPLSAICRVNGAKTYEYLVVHVHTNGNTAEELRFGDDRAGYDGFLQCLAARLG